MDKQKVLTKMDLVKELQALGFTREDGDGFVLHFFAAIKEGLSRGDFVKIASWGTFVLRNKPERPGRNPKTQKSHVVRARRVVTFRPSALFRQQVGG